MLSNMQGQCQDLTKSMPLGRVQGPREKPLSWTLAKSPCARPSPGAHVQDPRQGPLCRTQARGPCAGAMLASHGAHVQAVTAMLLLLPSRNKGLGQFFDPTMNHDISIPMMNHDIPMMTRPRFGAAELADASADSMHVRDVGRVARSCAWRTGPAHASSWASSQAPITRRCCTPS